MSPQILIQVTAKDISQGRRGNPFQCPIALAIQKYLPGKALDFYFPFVTTTASFRFWGCLRTTYLPREVLAWINYFDRTAEGEPFSFLLDLL